MTADDYRRLVDRGVVDKTELLHGVVYMGDYPLVFSVAQAAAARRMGIDVPSVVDAVLADPQARAEVAARIASAERS